MKKLNKFLEKKRKEIGLSQDDVGRLLGFSNGQFISNIEREDCGLPPKHFKKVSRVYGIEPMEMVQLAVDDYFEILKKAVGK